MYEIAVYKERPDFRVFVDLLYGYDRNVDTDGNSRPVNSRFWTDLYVKDRESNDPPVTIYAEDEKSIVFEVNSDSIELSELAALYLFEYCGESISHNGKQVSNYKILQLQEKCSVQMDRARKSIWHESSDHDPYPNIP